MKPWWRWRPRRRTGDSPDDVMRELFKDSSSGVLFVDKHRRIVSANHAARDLIDTGTAARPSGMECGAALSCPLGTECPLAGEGHPETSKSCEAPVFERTVSGSHGGENVLISCHRLPFGPRTEMRGMVVIRKRWPDPEGTDPAA